MPVTVLLTAHCSQKLCFISISGLHRQTPSSPRVICSGKHSEPSSWDSSNHKSHCGRSGSHGPTSAVHGKRSMDKILHLQISEFEPVKTPISFLQEGKMVSSACQNSEGLPLAVQLVGKRFGEEKILRAMADIEGLTKFPMKKTK